VIYSFMYQCLEACISLTRPNQLEFQLKKL